jgi:type I restriction enzyme, S subunit
MTAEATMLRRLLRRREESNHPDLPVLSVYREHGVIPKSSRDDNHNRTPEDLTHYLRVCPADLVVNKMKAWSGSLGVAEHEGIVSGDYLVCEVSTRIESRYLHHLLRSHRLICEMRRRSRGIRPQQERLYWEDLGDIQIVLPAVEEQRRIADFLDDQVTRIDEAAGLVRQHAPLLHERASQQLFALYERGDTSRVPLSALGRIVDTEHRTAPGAPGGEHWSAGTGSVRHGRLLRERLTEISRSAYTEWTRRGRPGVGDVLLTREAPVGEVALIERDDPSVAIGQRVVLFKPSPQRLLGEYLVGFLLSPHFTFMIDDRTQGFLHPHLNMSDISRLRIPVPSLQDQLASARIVRALLANRRNSSVILSRRIELLQERKAALITAAVMGEFDVTTAGPRAAAAVTG